MAKGRDDGQLGLPEGEALRGLAGWTSAHQASASPGVKRALSRLPPLIGTRISARRGTSHVAGGLSRCFDVSAAPWLARSRLCRSALWLGRDAAPVPLSTRDRPL